VHRVGYKNILQQKLYFEMLMAIDVPPTSTVLDVGCGYGDMYDYLLGNGYRGRYIGIDLLPHFIDEAQQRFSEAIFVLGDIVSIELESCDYALASGPFDYRTPNSQERWAMTIARMFELAQMGIAWNGIMAAPEEREDLWAQPLPMVMDLCSHLSPYYAVRSDYDPPHFTAYVYKREHFYSDNLRALIGHLYLHPEYSQELQTTPSCCAKQFGVSLQQLSMIESLWAS